MSIYIDRLRDGVETQLGCKASYVEGVQVEEPFGEGHLWGGKVLVFELHGHPDAERAYGWGIVDDDFAVRHIVIPRVPPINGPVDAVKAAIAQGDTAPPFVRN